MCEKHGYYATIASGNPSWLHIQRAAQAAKVSCLKLHGQKQLKRRPTLIAIPDCVEVHIVLVVGKEEKAEPGVKGVDGYDEKDAHYVPLLLGRAVVTQMHVDLQKKSHINMLKYTEFWFSGPAG